MQGLTLEQMTIGQTASFSKTITETDVTLFAGISGDFNPVHIDETHAKESFFKARIAHGMLGASLISAVLGMKLPGPGSIYLKQELKFKAPVYLGNTITATCTLKEIVEEKNIVIFECSVTNQDGVVVIEGDATIKPPKKR